MTPQEQRYITLSDKFEIAKKQIFQIEGEYDFLLQRIGDSYNQDAAKVANKILNDPKAKSLIGNEIVSGLNASIKEVEDDIELDRSELVNQIKGLNRELKVLHLKQIDIFEEMNTLTQEYEIGDSGGDVFFKANFEDAVEDCQDSCLSMVTVLDDQYKRLDDLN